MSFQTTFDHQQYLNLETFRKNGAGVKTPVWFVENVGSLFVRTDAASAKVKRIRNNPQVSIAPCKVDGAILSDWMKATASIVNEEEIDCKIDSLLGKKYGVLKFLFSLSAYIQGRKYTIIEITERV